MLAIPQNVLFGFGGLVAILCVGTLVTFLFRLLRPGWDSTEVVARVKTWWIIIGLFTATMLAHKLVAIGFFCFVSILALREYLRIIPSRAVDHRLFKWLYGIALMQFFWIGISWYGMFTIFIPVYVFLFLPMRLIIYGETTGFLFAVSSMQFGLMTTVYCLSHVAYLLQLPEAGNPNGGGLGLVLFFVFHGQFNDVLQFLWGKAFGRIKVVPTISPGKTFAGLLGGIVTTTTLACFTGPWLTPLSTLESALAGVIISLGGFIGDVSISAIKRDLKLKDSGQLLPGHGGILDRIDSLYYIAPLFFHYLRFLKYT